MEKFRILLNWTRRGMLCGLLDCGFDKIISVVEFGLTLFVLLTWCASRFHYLGKIILYERDLFLH